MIGKNIRKVTWNSKILKNKSKDSDSNFLVMFSSSKASRAIEKREGMAHWFWPQFMKCAQHAAHNPKFGRISATPGSGHKKIKGPTHMVLRDHKIWWLLYTSFTVTLRVKLASNGVGVTEAPFIKFSVKKSMIESKYLLDYFNQTHSYLTGATAAELRDIQWLNVFTQGWKIRK